MDTKKLRQKVLDLAIRGKLVPQNPNDEPASVLLEQIQKERERLIKEGKIKQNKKEKTSDKFPYENLPFEVPKSWEWCRLSDIASFYGGKTPSTDNKLFWDSPDILWVTSKDMKTKYIEQSQIKMSVLGAEQMQIFSVETILMVVRSGILRNTLPIAILKKESTINQDLKAICLFYEKINEFIYTYLKAQEKSILNDYAKTGTTVESINFDKLINIEIPLPPLPEQRRIISKIDECFALIDQIEESKLSLSQFIKQTKSKVLDLAIRGKLVPQDPNDEPASALLERISKEQKTKKVPADILHYPFEVPEGWTWCRLGEIFQITMGQSPEGSSVTHHNQGTEFHQGKLCFSEKYLEKSNTYTDNPTKIAEPNSLLLCVRAPVGIVNITTRKICIGRGLSAIKIPEKMNILFAFYWLKTLEDSFNQKATGSTFTAISGDIIKNELIPLPPLSEQSRIVTKIETIFSLLDKIEKSLKA